MYLFCRDMDPMSVMSDTVYIDLIIVSDEWICKQHFTVTCILQYYNININK